MWLNEVLGMMCMLCLVVLVYRCMKLLLLLKVGLMCL